MDQPDARPLAAVVQQTGHKQVRVRGAGRAEVRDHVQAVAAICDMHPIEQLERLGGEPAGQFVALSRRNAGTDVRPGPPELRGPPAAHPAS